MFKNSQSSPENPNPVKPDAVIRAVISIGSGIFIFSSGVNAFAHEAIFYGYGLTGFGSVALVYGIIQLSTTKSN
jgi:hypothetical protein